MCRGGAVDVNSLARGETVYVPGLAGGEAVDAPGLANLTIALNFIKVTAQCIIEERFHLLCS